MPFVLVPFPPFLVPVPRMLWTPLLAFLLCYVFLLPWMLSTPAPLCSVRGRSMLPAMADGDLVVVANGSREKEIRVGDVVVYETHWSPQPIIHRVVKVRSGGGRFLTRGDNNRRVDPDWVARDRILGVVRFKIPWLGKLRTYLPDLTWY